MPKDAINDDVLKYRDCLKRVRHHLRIVTAAFSGHLNPGLPDITTELIYLHFRQALEEMAFSSLCANVDKYSSVYADFASHWNAKKLLKKIGTINPNFFPVPIPLNGVLGSARGPGGQAAGEGTLTREDFTSLYSLSSGFLHAPNPYRPDEKTIDKYSIPEWLTRFRNLLRMHSIQLVDYDETWMAMVPDDGPIQVGVSRLVETPTLPQPISEDEA